MELIGASVVFVCDEEFSIIKNGGVLLENGCIIDVGKYDELESKLDFQVNKNISPNTQKPKLKSKKSKIANATYIKKQFFSDCVLLPALINAHIHFEFGANTASFAYGSFEAWLESVMSYRGDVLEKLDSVLSRQIATQLASGVGSVGAISSYGGDMLALAHCPLRVVYFCEALGANKHKAGEVFSHFKERFFNACELQEKLQNQRFMPRVAIHSPYSVCDELAKQVVALALQTQSNKNNQKTSQKPIISAHFLESASEREWLESKSGWFKNFYETVLKIPNPKPFYSIDKFLELFSQAQAVLTHCIAMSERELEMILEAGHFITTCPRSNRLLGGKMLDIARFAKIKNYGLLSRLAIGTDGASSNVNTNMLDEMRAGLFGFGFLDSHKSSKAESNTSSKLESIAKMLILSATRYGAQALGLENGELKEEKYADLAVFKIPQIADSATPILHFLTNATKAHRLYINGQIALES